MRRFELSDGSSHKFWQIEQDGQALHLWWGRIGTNGQAKTKSLDSAAAANTDAEKQIRSKVKKGYAEVAVKPEQAAAMPKKAPASKSQPSEAPDSTLSTDPEGEETLHEASSEAASIESAESRIDTGGLETGDTEPTPELPPEDQIEWPEDLLKRVLPRRDVPWPGPESKIRPPKVTVRAAYRAFHKAWPRSSQLGHYLPPDFRDHFISITHEFTSPLPDQAPLPEDPKRQGTMLLALRLKLPAEYHESRDPASRHVIDYWVQGAGVCFAVDAVCQTLLGDLETTPNLNSVWRGSANGMARWGFGGFDRLRVYLCAANDEDYAAAREIADSWWDRFEREQKIVLSFLFPERREWLEECLDLGTQNVIYQNLLIATVSTLGQIERLDAERFLSRFLGAHKDAEILPTLVFALGIDGIPFFVDHLRQLSTDSWRQSKAIQEVASVVALYPDDEAISALLPGLEDKDIYGALQAAIERFPKRCLRLLCGELNRRGARMQRASLLIKGILNRYPTALDSLESLDPESRERVAKLMVAQEEASPEDLPEVLRSPPWERRPKIAKAKPIQLEAAVEPHRMAWAEGEQMRFARYRPLDPDYHHSPLVHGLLSMDSKPAGRKARRLRDWNRTEAVHHLPRLLAAHELQMVSFLLGLSGLLVPRAASSILPIDSVQLALPVAEWFARHQNAKPNARRWLLARASTAALGLLPVAVGAKGKARDAAIEALRMLSHNGERDAIEAAIEHYSAQSDAGSLRRALAPVLDVEPLFVLPARLPQLPTFADALTLPRPTLRDGRQIPEGAANSLLLMLAFSSSTDPYAGLQQVKEACDSRSLARFVDGLFDAWIMNGADSKQKWAFFALGHLGGDAAARRLEPLIRVWPKESAYPRAVLGLEVLGLIGTDMALMLVHGLAQKASKGLQRAAQEAIDRMSAERGLSTEELADRLVPDLGLSADGSLRLDYGTRHFFVTFDEQLKPLVIDQTGKKRKTAPKPGARDEALQANAAFDAWKELKKDARKVAKGQIERLERAMCAERRWSREDFESLLAGHPLLVHLVRRLLWGVFAAEKPSELRAAFRVDADGTYADIEDEPFELPAEGEIGLVHRLDLGAAEADAWRESWSDYELISPFPQLDRDIYRLEPGEEEALRIRRFEGTEIPGGRVLGLERWGWRKGEVADGGLYWWMIRPFADGTHEAVLHFEPGIPVGDPTGFEPPVLKDLAIFRVGVADSRPAMAFGKVPPKVFSEIIRDLEELRRPR